MKYYVLCVRDRAANVFGQPFCAVSKGGAIRSFSDEINNPQGGMMSKHPEDFDLYDLGTFNDATGLFETGAPQQLAVGKDLVISK